MGERRHTREASGLVLDRELRWWHDGVLVEHPRIIEAFNRGVRIGDDGRARLELGDDWCFIEVGECAFGVIAVDAAGDDRLSLRLSDRTAEWLDAAALRLGDDGVLTVAVKEGRARARFSRDAQFALASRLEAHGEAVELRVGERRWATSLPRATLEE